MKHADTRRGESWKSGLACGRGGDGRYISIFLETGSVPVVSSGAYVKIPSLMTSQVLLLTCLPLTLSTFHSSD